jgi:nucleoside-diphosphate-sugar epimerase
MIRFYRKFFRYQYSAVLMWLVMAAVGIRFLLIVPGYLLFSANPAAKWRKLDVSRPMLARFGLLSRNFIQRRNNRRVIVTGATSLIGDYLLSELLELGFEVHAISRNPPSIPPISGLHWHKANIASDAISSFGADTLIHLAPLSTLPPLLEKMAGRDLKRIIAFSSTSLFTKFQSGYEKERLMAHGLKNAEDKLADLCERHAIHWTVFRPTLVYHLGRDKNVTTIARFIRRFGFFPLVGDGKGLRQPVHAEDLAKACINAIDNPSTFGQAYNLSGGEMLTYREMVTRIATRMGYKSRIVNIPLPALRFFLLGLSYIPRYRHLTPEMANRINRDMCFDHLAAFRDLDFSPRRFLEDDVNFDTMPRPSITVISDEAVMNQ